MQDLKIFISSTYEDLKPYRERVIDFLKKGIGEIIFKGMEDMPASDERPVDECKKKVEESNVFILIIGKRYGWIPDDKDINPGNVSITELEYNWAKAGNKTILCFVAGRDIKLESDNESDKIIQAEKEKNLARFISVVKGKAGIVPVEGFLKEDDLVYQVSKALWNKFVGTPFEKRIEEERIYCCDRDDNYWQFKINYKEEKLFNLFLAIADRVDLVENFFNRIVIFDYNGKPEELKILPQRPPVIDREKCFLNHIERIAWVIDKNSKSLRNAVSNYCGQFNKNIYFKTDVSALSVLEIKDYISYLQQLFTTIKQEIENLNMVKFILFVYSNQKSLYNDLQIEDCVDLMDFKTVKVADLEKWLEENVSHNAGVRNAIIEEYFLDADKDIKSVYQIDYAMTITDRKMRIMVRDYNDKTGKIWKIVNPT